MASPALRPTDTPFTVGQCTSEPAGPWGGHPETADRPGELCMQEPFVQPDLDKFSQNVIATF